MKNILIVIDMQKGFARYEQTINLASRIGELLNMEVFDKVVATRFLNSDNSVYESLLGWSRLKNEEDQALVASVEDRADIVVDKYIYNCVNNNFIQKLSQLNDGEFPKQVFIMGADTDCCVLTIATSLFECGIRPIVLTQYCCSNGGGDANEAGLQCMRRLIGKNQLADCEITSRDDLEKIL